jgi:hypothetical protein
MPIAEQTHKLRLPATTLLPVNTSSMPFILERQWSILESLLILRDRSFGRRIWIDKPPDFFTKFSR